MYGYMVELRVFYFLLNIFLCVSRLFVVNMHYFKNQGKKLFIKENETCFFSGKCSIMIWAGDKVVPVSVSECPSLSKMYVNRSSGSLHDYKQHKQTNKLSLWQLTDQELDRK